VYDIMADYRLRPQDAMFLAVPQAVLVVCAIAALARLLLGTADSWKQVQVLLVLPVASGLLYGFYYAAHGSWVWSQWRCRRWYRAGEYAVTEGVVSGYESRYAERLSATNRRGTPKKTVTFRVTV